MGQNAFNDYIFQMTKNNNKTNKKKTFSLKHNHHQNSIYLQANLHMFAFFFFLSCAQCKEFLKSDLSIEKCVLAIVKNK